MYTSVCMYSHFIIFTVKNTHTKLQTTRSVALIFHNPTSRKFLRITRKIFNVHNVVNIQWRLPLADDCHFKIFIAIMAIADFCQLVTSLSCRFVKPFFLYMKQLNNGHYEWIKGGYRVSFWPFRDFSFSSKLVEKLCRDFQEYIHQWNPPKDGCTCCTSAIAIE